jgi:hypothetical protein
MICRSLSCAIVVLLLSSLAMAQKSEDFSTDPNWDALNNRLLPDPLPVIEQSFGYSPNTNHAGGSNGEIGGLTQRSTTPAYYAMKIPTRTFNNKLKASGKFSVTRADGSSGALFGWFNDKAEGWRTPNSLMFRIDGNGDKYWVFIEYGTQHWLTGGMGCFEGERYQTTKTPPFRSDGTAHEWMLEYDPAANGGSGAVIFTLDGKTYTLNVAPEHRADGLELNRFGMLNHMLTGHSIEPWFDDLTVDGEKIDFSKDPGWESGGSQVKFGDRIIRPLHDFGFSPDTNFAGGSGKGEVGGTLWRGEYAQPAYYAARLERLTLNDAFSASGRIAFTRAGSDSGSCFGWFDSTSKQNKTSRDHPSENILGIMIEGPSRIGHYFRPFYNDSTGAGELKPHGPIIRPDGKAHTFAVRYDPSGAGGNGKVIFKLDNDEQTYDLPAGAKRAGASFDRFGFFNLQTKGNHTTIYIDDLKLTPERRSPRGG